MDLVRAYCHGEFSEDVVKVRTSVGCAVLCGASEMATAGADRVGGSAARTRSRWAVQIEPRWQPAPSCVCDADCLACGQGLTVAPSPRLPFYHLQGNFVLIYELLDEVLDHGYPQVGGGTAVVLQLIASHPGCSALLLGQRCLCTLRCACQLSMHAPSLAASAACAACPPDRQPAMLCCAALCCRSPTPPS